MSPRAVAGQVPPTASTTFVGVTREEVLSHYDPASPPSLVLRFLYDDPAFTPQAAVDRPVAVFTFANAVVLRHEDEPAEPDTPADALRQVEGFDDHEATATFAFSSLTTHVVFTAATLTLTLEPDQPWPPVLIRP